ncbi:MAG: TonB-dependent receptor [Sphingomonadaceae bacterium]|nr:TonB-dependent receptor [Sphingomonadaceae bacterium]
MVTPQKPTNSFGGYASVKLGDYNLRQFDAALNVPLVDDKVLLRGAIEVARRDGFTKNIGNGEDQDNIAYESYRLGIVLRPVEGLENYTSFQYQRTHDNGTSVVPEGVNVSALTRNYGALASLFNGIPGVFNGYDLDARGNVVPRGKGVQPLTVAALVQSFQNQLAAQQARGHRVVDYDDPSFDRRRNIYVVNTTTADLTDTIQLKNIFGYINERDDEASNFTGTNGFAITTCHSACENIGGSPGGGLPFTWQEQFSEEFRLSGKSFNNNLTWNAGFYADEQRPGGPSENDVINVAILERGQVQNETNTSKAGYLSAEYDLHDLLPGLKINGGIRRTHDTVDAQTITYNRPIYTPVGAVFPAFPHGQCVNYSTSVCDHYKAAFNVTTWAAGVSYKLDNGPLLYAKASRGYRPGGVNASVTPGSDPSYQPEFDRSIEIGAKGSFNLGGGARLSADIAAYTDQYSKIQKLIAIVDPRTGSPTSITTNAANARIKGIEFDSTLYVRGLNIGGTFAYTDAKFKKGGYVPGTATDPCNPTLNPIIGFCPYNRFNSTPKFQYTLNANYTLPLDPSIGKVTIGGNYYHQSSVALTDTSAQNPDAIEPGYGLLDVNVTWANVMQQPIDLGFFMTNVTNKVYQIGRQSLSQQSSFGNLAYIYGAPRMFGFSLKYRFGADAR